MDTSDLADRLDDVGIGILASPYLAEAAAKPLMRSPRLAPLGALAHGYHEAFHRTPYGELAGLGLVAPSITHGLAKGIEKVLPDKTASYLEAAFVAGFRKTAEELSAGGYTEDEARQLYHGRDVNIEEVTDGLNDELEHRDITHGKDALTKQIVDAHLKDDPHYYRKLQEAGL